MAAFLVAYDQDFWAAVLPRAVSLVEEEIQADLQAP
jgi:hypothetical protein